MNRMVMMAMAMAVVGRASTAIAQCQPEWSSQFLTDTLDGGGGSLAVFDDDGGGPKLPALFVGRSFSNVAGVANTVAVARWDGVSWSALGGPLSGGFGSPSVVLAITGKYDPLIGSAMNVVLIGALIFGTIATVLAIGITLAIFCQSRVVKRHARRLNAATAAAGAASTLVFLAIIELAPGLKGGSDRAGLTVMAIVVAAAITLTVLQIMLRKHLLLPPLASLCPNCGYPVGKSSVCTECGKPVRPS